MEWLCAILAYVCSTTKIMNCWLIVNGFTNWDKFNELYQLIEASALKAGVNIVRKKHTDVWFELKEASFDASLLLKDIDFVIFWDKDVRLAALLENSDTRVFNSSRAIALCDNKADTYIALLDTGIRQPNTYLSAKQFRACTDLTYYHECANSLGYPLIIKESYGSFGAQVYLIRDESGLSECILKLEAKEFLMQEYVESSKGRDIRLQMVGDECVACMYRYNENDFRANVTNGGAMKPYVPNEQQLEMARKVMNCLGLDFAGIDIMFGDNDQPIFCEANSNAHFKNLYNCTGINTADYIFKYILDKVNEV